MTVTSAPFPAPVMHALRDVVDVRSRYSEMIAAADAAFQRYFAKRQAGQRTSGAAWQRLENQANYFSADHVTPTETHACALLDQVPGTWDLEQALRAAGLVVA